MDHEKDIGISLPISNEKPKVKMARIKKPNQNQESVTHSTNSKGPNQTTTHSWNIVNHQSKSARPKRQVHRVSSTVELPNKSPIEESKKTTLIAARSIEKPSHQDSIKSLGTSILSNSSFIDETTEEHTLVPDTKR